MKLQEKQAGGRWKWYYSMKRTLLSILIFWKIIFKKVSQQKKAKNSQTEKYSTAEKTRGEKILSRLKMEKSFSFQNKNKKDADPDNKRDWREWGLETRNRKKREQKVCLELESRLRWRDDAESDAGCASHDDAWMRMQSIWQRVHEDTQSEQQSKSDKRVKKRKKLRTDEKSLTWKTSSKDREKDTVTFMQLSFFNWQRAFLCQRKRQKIQWMVWGK